MSIAPMRPREPIENGEQAANQAAGSAVELAYDQAMAASLSAAVYTDNIWMIESIGRDSKAAASGALASEPESDPHGGLRALFLAKTCRAPMELEGALVGTARDPITGQQAEYSCENGVLRFGDLAAACLLERKKLDGTTRLELCFRGTETSGSGSALANAANLIHGYLFGSYPYLFGHYERHRLLIDRAIAIVNARAASGEKIQLGVSGHSLGGSMAEIFIQRDARRLDPSCGVHGTTFGSPGIGARQSAFSMLVKGFIRLLAAKAGLLTENHKDPALVHAEPTKDGLPCQGRKIPSLDQFIDPDDPVPKLGLLGGYLPSGKVFFSRKPSRNSMTGNPLAGSLLDIARHSVAKYENSAFLNLCRQSAYAALRGMPTPFPAPLAILSGILPFSDSISAGRLELPAGRQRAKASLVALCIQENAGQAANRASLKILERHFMDVDEILADKLAQDQAIGQQKAPSPSSKP